MNMQESHYPHVQVLMSTYNGMRYLREQLDSIYNQQGVRVSLLVRDDGSTDGTRELLDSEQREGRLTWYTGPNLRPAKSFWHLLCKSSCVDFYAFADQDDVWDSDKLQVAVECLLQVPSAPALYFCQTQLVDAKLQPLPNVDIHPLLTYGEALITQFVGGCTMVFSNALRKELVRYTPNYMRMHDLWIYDVALALDAKVYFDPVPRIRYRQHEHNAVGQLNSLSFRWRERINRLMKNERIRLRTAEELWAGYAESMPLHNRLLTYVVINYRKDLLAWWRLMFSSAFRCGNRTVRRYSRLAIFLHRF